MLSENVQHNERWKVTNSEDPEMHFEGTVDECNKWAHHLANSGKLRSTVWEDLTPPEPKLTKRVRKKQDRSVLPS